MTLPDFLTIAACLFAAYVLILWIRDVHLDMTEERDDGWVI